MFYTVHLSLRFAQNYHKRNTIINMIPFIKCVYYYLIETF